MHRAESHHRIATFLGVTRIQTWLLLLNLVLS
jgi:hypothetical protein